MQIQVDRIRIGGSKVKSGCLTCKARRVKCDEAKPGCKRCERAGRTCEGYAPFLQVKKAAVGGRFVHYVDPAVSKPQPNPNTHTDLDIHARRSLEFFQHSTALQLEQPFGLDIWSHDLSCLMHSEPAVKHGLVALAALHENYQHASESVFVEQRRILALEHYGRSIQKTVQSNMNDAQRAFGPTVVTSLLYCAIESLQGHSSSAIKHITAGVRLLSECESTKQGSGNLPKGLLATLRCVFINLCTQAMALEESAIEPVVSQSLNESQHSIGCSFSTTGQALTEIARLLNDVMRVLSWTEAMCESSKTPTSELQRARPTLLQRYECWTEEYHTLLRNSNISDRGSDRQRQLAFRVLRMNQAMTSIVLTVICARNEMGIEPPTNDFEVIVSAAEEIVRLESEQAHSAGGSPRPIFSLTLGIIPALFFACIRCRNNHIRHRALSAMKSCRRRESVWDSSTVAVVAERAIAVDEAAATQV